MDFLSNLFGGSSINQVDPGQVQLLISQNPRPFLLDVRTLQEFQEGHINGSVSIPLGDLTNRLNRIPKDKVVVCICASGSRSSAAARQLEGAGYQVKNMKGGIAKWIRSGLPVSKATRANVGRSK
jgi:rhodanese-related sulfurtransferase